MGGSGFFSGFGPTMSASCAFLSLFFSEIPPSVPLVPSFGPVRFGSSITPSFVSGRDATFVMSLSGRLEAAASSSPFSLAFFRSRSALVSTKGPAWGLPSFPSTGASLVPELESRLDFTDRVAGMLGDGPAAGPRGPTSLPSARSATCSALRP